ncbi:UDP-N-acetylglucosamine--N-acetylmuramyl-(pentapeptide) pyrophosphoryl-undecaprenol N-acetylglucosamine transferase [Candidatus Kaiserbacteria bacterium]|nr:UDP-N-acetylglucosamine--N-acetylmuramyl-(pentapeptide) pyrophosphoryl-undecaprenol N-acetylglucosamine transferase [Candidatus Kaiserbacteria bacterium]NCT01744.1 UDP-N-acetylglucosamine--N-acetylmuramyl-(pentapeptide) pyrophosphoryl-undecaprenol N-acetylglucosamine transferase [Candidatus Parcubacteria bacterium]
MKIGFVGGGTGGHFYPLIAVADELNKSEYKPELYYFGPSRYDKDSLTKYGITFVYCPAGKLRNYFSIQNFIDIFRNFFGIFIAIWKLYIIYPDVIFSKGGYTSVPILLAARFLAIPVVIHESDAVPGKANKLATKQARYIAISYDDAAKFFPAQKTALTGIPLRPEIKEASEDPFTALGIPNDKPLIYVTGGSSGASRINDAVLQALSKLLPMYRIFHQTGANTLDEVRLSAQGLLGDSPLRESYYIEGNISAPLVNTLMTAASLIITRAGSTTLFEIAYHGKPAIVVPIPEDISRDQRTNAYAYARSGAASVIEEHNLTTNLLAQEIQSILNDQNRYQSMSKAAKSMYIEGAESKLANILVSIGIEHAS